MKPTLTVEEVRHLDRLTEQDYHIPTLLLMENAGRSLCDHIEKLLSGSAPKIAVWVVCGTGNNGGDGLVAARHLFQRKIPVSVFFAGDPEKFAGDAAINYRIVDKLKIKTGNILELQNSEGIPGKFKKLVIIDAILGTGFKGNLRPPAETAVKLINFFKKKYPEVIHIVSADIPSGLSGDDGPVGCEAVRADSTITFACMKKGLILEKSKPFVGNIEVVDIGIPEELIQSLGNNTAN